MPPRSRRATPTASAGGALRRNPGDGRERPRSAAGEHGEIWIARPDGRAWLLEQPGGYAREFTGGFWHSGDVGSIDAEGYVRVLDRKKDMINRGGYKVYRVEVENVLDAHPGVVECAVVGKPCPVLGERVHAFVVSQRRRNERRELRAFCAERLADYKVPESFTLSTEPLPRNANGKVLKRELRG